MYRPSGSVPGLDPTMLQAAMGGTGRIPPPQITLLLSKYAESGVSVLSSGSTCRELLCSMCSDGRESDIGDRFWLLFRLSLCCSQWSLFED
jgi:hypothetical protein